MIYSIIAAGGIYANGVATSNNIVKISVNEAAFSQKYSTGFYRLGKIVASGLIFVDVSISGVLINGSAILQVKHNYSVSGGIKASGLAIIATTRIPSAPLAVRASGSAVLNVIHPDKVLVSCRFLVNEIVYIPDFRNDNHIRKKVLGICALNIGNIYYDIGDHRWLSERYLMSFDEYRASLIKSQTLVPRNISRTKTLVPFLTSQVVLD